MEMNKNILRQTVPWSFVSRLCFSSIVFSMFRLWCVFLSVLQHIEPGLQTEDNLKKEMTRMLMLISCLKNMLREERRQQFLAFSSSNKKRFWFGRNFLKGSDKDFYEQESQSYHPSVETDQTALKMAQVEEGLRLAENGQHIVWIF